MCISPVTIKNPNYGKKFKKGQVFSLKDCTSRYIRVPCGKCIECIHTKQMAMCQRVQMESLKNYVFFSTLTYKDSMIPKLTTSQGIELKYADWHDLQNMFKRLRKKQAFGRRFRYLAVSELGSKRGRPHFHILWFLPKYETDNEFTPINLEKIMFEKVLTEWARNVGSTKKPDYRPCCSYRKRIIGNKVYTNYDLHYVTPSVSDTAASNVTFYVTKYMLKRSDRETKLQQALRLNLSEDEYKETWKIIHSRVNSSLRMGLAPDEQKVPSKEIIEYIQKSIKNSDEFPKFYSLNDGKSFPLARYYKSKGYLYTFEDALRFKEESGNLEEDGFYAYDQKPINQLIKNVKDHEKKIEITDHGSIDDYISMLNDD